MARRVKTTDRNKRHNKRQSRSRQETTLRRRPREYFLIVTNGSETELEYFESISRKMPPNVLKEITVKFRNADPKGVVEYALEKARQDHYQHVAAVFDKDDFVHFSNAIAKMKAAAKRRKEINFYTAYSNECFELWMLLHFQDVNSALGRDALFKKLEQHVSQILGRRYVYEKTGFPFELLDMPGNREDALRRAAQILQEAQRLNPRKPWTINPATAVHILVGELAEFMT